MLICLKIENSVISLGSKYRNTKLYRHIKKMAEYRCRNRSHHLECQIFVSFFNPTDETFFNLVKRLLQNCFCLKKILNENYSVRGCQKNLAHFLEIYWNGAQAFLLFFTFIFWSFLAFTLKNFDLLTNRAEFRLEGHTLCWTVRSIKYFYEEEEEEERYSKSNNVKIRWFIVEKRKKQTIRRRRKVLLMLF